MGRYEWEDGDVTVLPEPLTHVWVYLAPWPRPGWVIWHTDRDCRYLRRAVELHARRIPTDQVNNYEGRCRLCFDMSAADLTTKEENR
jgi:hypothetical protein